MAIIMPAIAIKRPKTVQSIENIAVTVSIDIDVSEKKYSKGVKAKKQKPIIKPLMININILTHFLFDMLSLGELVLDCCSFSIFSEKSTRLSIYNHTRCLL